MFGIPEDMGDKKLADLFTPYGTVIYAKVGVEKDTGRNRTYGMSPLSLSFSQSSPLFTAGAVLTYLLSTFTTLNFAIIFST